MKLYLSSESRKSLRKCFRSFKDFAVIDITQVRKELGYDKKGDNIYATFIINQEIKRRLHSFYRSKRFKAVLYIVDELSDGFVHGFREYLGESGIHFTEVILMECVEPVDNTLYRHFNTVI